MGKYQVDEINFHGFLNAMRKLRKVTLEQLSEGLCSVSMLDRIEKGERLPEKQMRDRIVARLGVSGEGYEDYLTNEEYDEWVLRQNIFKSIEEKDILSLERYLAEYVKKEDPSGVENQFFEAMSLMLLRLKDAPFSEQKIVVEKAVKFTVPVSEEKFPDMLLLSEQEIYLLTEYVYFMEYREGIESELYWRLRHYEKLHEYLNHSHLEKLAKAKVYPKMACCMCELILEKAEKEEFLWYALSICNEGIELLRDTKKCYYFVELLELRMQLIERILEILDTPKKEELYSFTNQKIETRYSAEWGRIIFSETDAKEKEIKSRKSKEALLEELEESKKWHSLFLELYEEYGVSPYMEHFCHVYWETESYCIADVIRIRREMFGMSLKELSKGVCSLKTLKRLERKETKTQMAIVRELFRKLGLCAEYIRAKIITNNDEALLIYDIFTKYINNNELEKAKECMNRLKKIVCMDIAVNKQAIMRAENILKLRTGEIRKEEAITKTIESLECTVLLEKVINTKERYLTREEIACINSIFIEADREKQEQYMSIIEEICVQYLTEDGILSHISVCELLLTRLASYFGNCEEYDKSEEYSTIILKESLVCRRMGKLANNLFNHIWNYKQKILQNMSVEKEYDIKRELERCILLSVLNKAENLKHFFEDETNLIRK